MLKQIWALCRKELRLWTQKIDQWAVLFVVPVAFIWIMGTAFSSDAPTVAIYAANDDTGERGEEVIDALLEANNLEVDVLPDRAEADRLVGAGKRMAAVVVPAGFSEALLTDEGAVLEVIVDPAREEQAQIVLGLVQAGLVRFIVDVETTRGVNQGVENMLEDMDTEDLSSQDRTQIMDFITTGIKGMIAKQILDTIDDPLVKVESESIAENPSVRAITPFQAYIPGFSLMFVFFLANNLATTVMDEREVGALRRLLVAPVSRGVILLGKLLPYLLLAIVQLVVLFSVCSVFFDVEMGDAPLALGAVMVCVAASVAGLGIMIAAITKTKGQADSFPIVIIAMAIMSGCVGPYITVPGIKYATPHYWALLGFQNVMVRGMGFSGAWLPCGILLAFGVVFFIIGVRRFKFE